MISSEVIFKRDSAGKIRVWSYEVEGDKFRTIAGIEDGSLVTSKWTVCAPKSKDTAEEQAAFEAQAEMDKKLDREYRKTKPELDSVPASVMLAKDYAKEGKSVTALLSAGKTVFSQPKLDGIRALVSRHGAFSREYQRHLNVDHIMEALAPLFKLDPNFQFDGELYNHDLKADFSKITSVVRKQDPTPEERAEADRLIQFHIYDIPSFGDRPFSDRREAMRQTAQRMPAASPIKFVETEIVANQAKLDELQAKYLEQGYEGQMIRLDAPYDFDKRSKSLLKRKEWFTEEFPLIRFEEGSGNWSECAKRAIFKMKDGTEGEAGMRGTQDRARELLTTKIGPKAQATIRHFGLMPTGGYRFPVMTDFHPEGRRD